MASSRGLSFTRDIYKAMRSMTVFDHFITRGAVLSSGGGGLQVALPVTEDMLNGGGVLHGGCLATAIDSVSSVGLMTAGEDVPIGVSINLNVTYLSPVQEGDHIVVDSRLKKLGHNVAFLEVDVLNESTGKVAATGMHAKFIGAGRRD